MASIEEKLAEFGWFLIRRENSFRFRSSLRCSSWFLLQMIELCNLMYHQWRKKVTYLVGVSRRLTVLICSILVLFLTWWTEETSRWQ